MAKSIKMKIEGNDKKPLEFFLKDFEKVEREDLKNFASRTLRPWNGNPPKYIISLLFQNLGFEKVQSDFEKITWIIYFKYKGKIFEIHDYKFDTWSLAANNNDLKEESELIEQLLDEIMDVLEKSSKYLDKKLSVILKEQLKNNNFYFKNSLPKLKAIYDFYLAKLLELKAAWEIAETEVIEEEQNSEIGKFKTTRYIDHKREKEIESSYYFFPLISIYFSILEFILDIFKCFQDSNVAYLEYRALNWKERFKLVFNLDDAELKKIYDTIVEIKENYRNPLSHGLNNEVNLLIGIEGEGVVPISYAFLKDKPHFTSKIISIEKSIQYVNVLENFFEYLKKTEPFNYYWTYLQYDFTIPKSPKAIENLKSHMTSVEDFVHHLDRIEDYYERKMNGEL